MYKRLRTPVIDYIIVTIDPFETFIHTQGVLKLPPDDKTRNFSMHFFYMLIFITRFIHDIFQIHVKFVEFYV